MIREALTKLVDGTDLTREECTAVMNEIMSGECTDAQIGGFLVALRNKGETVDEITAAASVMREKATSVPAPPDVIDTCGTGGDGQATFNVSTASAIVAAAGGAKVAKHGNRSVSSSSGSSQVLAELGVDVNASVETVSHCIAEAGIGFLFAPLLHGVMKHAIGPRKELGLRTVFNVLGPLTNPAGARRQVMGVYAPELVETLGRVLQALGTVKAVVVHGRDGLDEITITERTDLAILDGGAIRAETVAPEDFGLQRASLDDLRVASPAESAAVIRGVFAGDPGPARAMVLLNAGAALFVADCADSLEAGVALASETIDAGKATDTLERLVAVSNAGTP